MSRKYSICGERQDVLICKGKSSLNTRKYLEKDHSLYIIKKNQIIEGTAKNI
jgi:hypothetical protein